MENYYDANFRPLPKKTALKVISKQAPPASAHSELMQAVMPLYQVIRFANQAAEKKQPVHITVEHKIDAHSYTRTTMKGTFRSLVNLNKQITFESEDRSILHIFKIEQILAIQLR